jgi:hypothetical protein
VIYTFNICRLKYDESRGVRLTLAGTWSVQARQVSAHLCLPMSEDSGFGWLIRRLINGCLDYLSRPVENICSAYNNLRSGLSTID